MKFEFSDEQEQFRDVVRKFLQDRSPTTEVRRLMETEEGFDRGVWQQMIDLGLPAIQVPERYGGQGFGFVELAIALEEMGRALLCAPYFSSTVLAATAILEVASEEQKGRLLADIASGGTIATLAFTEPNGRWDAGGIEMIARRDEEGFRLTGEKSFVLDGQIADRIVAVAREPGSRGERGISFFSLPADAPGLTATPLETLDMTRKQSRLTFAEVPAELLGDAGAGAAGLRATLDFAAVALACEMVGGAQQLLESAVAYTKIRVQFGRTISSFQALKHKLADMLVDVELAKSAAYCAAEAAAEGDPDLSALASLAKSAASDAYMNAASETIQTHGGIGFTWDNDTHLWFRRAKSSEVFLGDPAYHRELLMQRWENRND